MSRPAIELYTHSTDNDRSYWLAWIAVNHPEILLEAAGESMVSLHSEALKSAARACAAVAQ